MNWRSWSVGLAGVSRNGHCDNLWQLHVLSRPDIRRSIGQLAECNYVQGFLLS